MDLRHLVADRRFSPEKLSKVNLFESERMFCDLYCFEPGQEQKLHGHAGSDKVYVVLEGTGRFRVGAEEREVGEGGVVAAPLGVEHGVKNACGARLVLLVAMAPNPGKHPAACASKT
ncbi:MAG: cupin domain-containing protein [Planctomycetes bacterium]|nr:cupin domain-containing protein [Planctomycetota bacterium]